MTADVLCPAPRLSEIWSRPLPHFERARDRLLCRTVSSLARRWILGIGGVERLAPEHDPFILVANHNQRPEAVVLPTILILLRGGRRIHFLADWPFLLVPGIRRLYRVSGVIPVGNKSARWRFFDRFRERLVPREPPLARAAGKLREGASVGLFPEAIMNRAPDRLLRGRPGAAALALETGVPIVPVGIRFPERRGPIRDRDRLTLEVGEPISPRPSHDLKTLHAQVMQRLSELSGKRWGQQQERKPCHDQA